jgi:phosphatidate cytidylyltransferase
MAAGRRSSPRTTLPLVSNFIVRVLVALVGVPVLLYAAVQGKWPLLALVLVLQIGCVREWMKITAARGQQLSLSGILIATAGLDASIYLGLVVGLVHQGLAVGMSAIGLVLLLETFRRHRAPLAGLSGTSLFLVYAALPLILWTALAGLEGADRFRPLGVLGTLFVITWVCDTAAYLGGRALGKHKLYVAASPNKTVEGFLAGVVFSFTILPVMAWLGWAAPNIEDMIVFPLIVGLVGQTGDLLESLMKREVQIKDSSSVIPGHGGFFDRFDSLLLSTPFLFAYMVLSATSR